jgi:hypothetical protein
MSDWPTLPDDPAELAAALKEINDEDIARFLDELRAKLRAEFPGATETEIADVVSTD